MTAVVSKVCVCSRETEREKEISIDETKLFNNTRAAFAYPPCRCTTLMTDAISRIRRAKHNIVILTE